MLSSVAEYILAAEPNKPATQPSKAWSNSTALGLKVEPFLSSENGGADIIGY